MKMMKFVLPALALTAWANVASATLSSPIYEIRECDANGDALSGPVATKDNPLQGGDTIYFVIRMLNPDFDTVADSATTPWAIKYKNGATGIEDLDWLVSAPGVGIVVNNTTRKAEFVKIAQHPVYTFYTDMVFKYQIKPGDIALPIRLASDLNGTPVASGSAGIYWFRDDLWEIGKSGTAVGTAKVGELKYAADEYLDAATVTGRPDSTLPSRRNNWDAYECGFYANTVKAVTQGGFAAKTTVYDGNVCMTVINKNSSTCTPIPTISLVGTPSDTSYLYVWSADDNIAEIVEGNDVIKVNTVAEMWNADGTGKLYNVKVGTIKLVAGQSDYKFTLTCKGKTVTPGQSVKIYLSESPNGFFKRGSGVVADYLEETVYIGEALQPNITITGPDSITVGADYKSALDTLTITTSEIYPLGKGEGLRVTVTPSFSDTSITENIYDYVRIADNNEGTSWNTDGPCDFVLTPGTDANLTKTLYLFGRGADKNTYGTKNISFTVTVEDADHPGSTTVFDNYYKLPAPLPITFVPASTGTGTLPQITTASALTVTANTDTKFSLKVTDNKKNIESPTGYTIQYKKKASDTWKTMDGKWKPNSSGILVSAADPSKFPTLKYAYTGSDYVTSFKLIAPDDLTEGSEVQITVSIEEPKSMFVRIIEEDGTESDTGTFVESDDDEVTIQVQLSEAYADATVYAFLVPDDDDTKAAVKGDPISTSTYNRGLEIKAGQKTSKLGYIQFVDGSRTGTHCQFKIELRNGPTYATSALVAGYESETFTVLVRNKTPSFNAVWMSGARVFESGGTMSGIVPQGANKTFTFDVSDVEADLTADGSDTAHREFEIHCVIEENDSPRLDCTLTGDPNNLSTNYTFMVEGTAKARFQLRDKDMNKYGSEFVCYIKVGSQPQVSVVSADGLDFFNEKSTGINNSKMNIVLSEAAAKAIKVKLTVTPASGTLPDGLSLPKLGGGYDTTTSDPDNGVYEFEILPNQPTKTFYFTELDGTSFTASTGWKIHAEVSSNTMPTDAATPDPDKTWAQYYIATDYYFTVDNVEPTFMCSLGEENTVSNAYAATIGTGGAITYSVNDIKADLENGIKVTWWCSDTGSADTTNITGTANCTYTPEFKSAGTKVVKVTVQDKDAASGIGTIIKQWYFTVATSKTLSTIASGPSGGISNSALSQHYATAEGLGQGHVWANGAYGSSRNFQIQWTMGLAQSADVYAFGYKVANPVDNGTLDGGMDIALDANGAKADPTAPTTPANYTYTDTRDSYLYALLITTVDETGAAVSSLAGGTISPERNGSSAAAVGKIPLPSKKNDDGNFNEAVVEAIFAKEYLDSDNCGDINQDGVPDVAVYKYGMGVYDPVAMTHNTGADLTDLSNYNEDGDYLPADNAAGIQMIPGLTNSWAKSVLAFGAKLELRGYHEGLNGNDNLANVNSGRDLSDLEEESWNSLGQPAGWSPERPTDPTKYDTDGDDLPDGYEYYYWYRAHVGDPYTWNHNNAKVLRRIYGHRYNPHHPEDGEIIPWQTIEEVFDPLDANKVDIVERDTDNDGINDLEEFVIGTNPIEWDTDGDGVSDYWELNYSKLSPINRTTDGVHDDGTARNDDGDYMARIDVGFYVIDLVDKDSGRKVSYAARTLPSLSGTTDSAPYNVIGFKSALDATRLYAYIGSSAAPIVKVTVGTTDKFYLTEDMEITTCRRMAVDGGTAPYVISGVYDPKDDLLQKGTEVIPLDPTAENATVQCFSRYYDAAAVGAARANGTFNVDRSYKLWRYGNTDRLAMGKEADIPTDWAVVGGPSYETVELNHWQVYQWRGFELDDKKDMGTGFSPLTAWFKTPSGVPHSRWSSSGIGKYEDTADFCTLDEFLVSVFAENSTGNQIGVEPTIIPRDNKHVTFNVYYSRYTTLADNNADDTVHGADSDSDGVPDGWELYVQAGPGTSAKYFDASHAANVFDSAMGARHKPTSLNETMDLSRNPITDEQEPDGLPEAQEFRGTDTRVIYANVPSIAGLQPYNDDDRDDEDTGDYWLNKFWPTDPWSSDTDCDGIRDGAERSAQFFIYGNPSDDGNQCIQGAGLNPCAWDTDNDGIPDWFEWQYHGSKYPRPDSSFDKYSDVAQRDILARGALDKTEQDCYGGMDGTRPDAFTGQDGRGDYINVNCDYDYDGLQNWQEYLTGTIRAFRYDDTTSPWEVFDSKTDPVGQRLQAIIQDTTTYPVQVAPDPTDTAAYPLGPLDTQYISDVTDYTKYIDALAEAVEPWLYGTIPAVYTGMTVQYPLSPLYTLAEATAGTHGAGSNPRGICDTLDWVTMYGSICNRTWDQANGHPYFFPDGPNHILKRYSDGSARMSSAATLASSKLTAYNRRIMEEALAGTTPALKPESVVQFGAPYQYFGTDPAKFDSDGDGLDDYYELFHGLNPMYGGLPQGLNGTTSRSSAIHDLLSEAYNGGGNIATTGMSKRYEDNVCATNNFWTYYTPGAGNDAEAAKYDFVKFPWMNGGAEADPDGDGVRNLSEAIQANAQANRTYMHTDPSPLWMTDSTYNRSIVKLSYQPVEDHSIVELLDLPDLMRLDRFFGSDIYDQFRWGTTSGWKWSFEENEGFDTDGDWYNDFREGQKGSNPQVADSPSRRQAMYFQGAAKKGAVQVQEDASIGMLLNGALTEQFFTTFTVECWARPDTVGGGTKQVLLERTIQVGNSNPGDMSYLRRNFQLGIDANGYWYAAFDNDGTSNPNYSEIKAVSPTAAKINTWTHIAATYDGAQLQLYLNGQAAGAPAATTLRPVTGALNVQTIINYYAESRPVDQSQPYADAIGVLSRRLIDTYIKDTAAHRVILMGAGVNVEKTMVPPAPVRDLTSLTLDENTDFNDYAYYYQGYLDEVRIWDGARSATEIANNYLVRMSMDDIAANRDEVYDGLSEGQSRDVNQAGADGELPAELVYHFSFDNLASAETETSIAQAPFGMQATTATAADAKYTQSVPANWVSPWWANISKSVATPADQVKSSVYGLTPYSMIPWVKNTVAHLPNFDGTSRDTVYWKEDYAGDTPASEVGRSKYAFPRDAEPYARVQLVTGSYGHSDLQNTTAHLYNRIDKANGSQYYYLYRFQRRNDALMNTDALPLGWAYAKYAPDMWDSQGATTTSEITGVDTDNNGVPDWADTKLGSAGKGLDDTITYPAPPAAGGITDTVAHHLARLLAKGANPSATSGDTNYKQTADFNSSGVPDWWEEMYNLTGNGLADDDNDGLSNYTEYLLSEVLNTGLGKVFNPTEARSISAYALDYFVQIGNLYTGEIFTDHDKVEDTWEDAYPRDYATRMEYDANLDNEGDGWSTRSEARYSQMVRPITASAISHINVFDEPIADYPVPTLALTVGYHDKALNQVKASGMVVYVKHVDSVADYDAKYVIPVMEASGTTTSNTLTQVLGRWSNRHAVGTLSPGHIKAGSIVLQSAYDPNAEIYSWTVSRHTSTSSSSTWSNVSYARGTRTEYLADVRKYGAENVNLLGTDSSYEDISDISFTFNENTRIATMQHNNGAVIMGTINLETGEYDIDLGVFKGGLLTLGTNTESTVSSEDQSYRLVYEAATPADIPRSLYLGQADVGAIKEGKNNVIVVSDTDGDGLYTPGEPMGFVYGVDVGWKGGKANVTLTDTSPISIRMDLLTGANDRNEKWGKWSDNEAAENPADDTDLKHLVRVRVVRSYANESPLQSATAIVYDKVLDLNSEIDKFLTEANFLENGDWDIDWSHTNPDDMTLPSISDILTGLEKGTMTNIQYRIVFGNEDIALVTSSSGEPESVAAYMFRRKFDDDTCRASVIPVSPTTGDTFEVRDIRPTFRWKLDHGDTYTAFRVVVKDKDKAGATFTYDSGLLPAPAKNSAGEYVWTAPLSVTDKMAAKKFTGDTSKGVYDNNKKYTYSISMYNAKFRTSNDANAGAGEYFLSVPENSIATGNASVKVRYLGPAAAATGKTIHLQAFTTPDFVGEPVASTYVANNANIDNTTTDFAANAKLIGLDKGTYYLRAFIDSDDNGVCDAWESMGYLCGQGTAGVDSIYNPVGINFSTGALGATAVQEIYIEDADTNQNTVPDAWEYDKYGAVNLAANTISTIKDNTGAVQYNNLGITFNDNVGKELKAQAQPGSVTEGMAGRVLLAMNTPTVAALTLGYDSLEAAEAAADTLDESASVVAITSLELDGTTATVWYTTDVNTVMSAAAAKSAFYVVTGNTLSFDLVVKTKANLADEWTKTIRTVNLPLGKGARSETVNLGDTAATSGFVTIELNQN